MKYTLLLSVILTAAASAAAQTPNAAAVSEPQISAALVKTETAKQECAPETKESETNELKTNALKTNAPEIKRPETNAPEASESVQKSAPNLSPVPRQTGGYVRPNADKRFKSYVGNMFGPIALARNVASAGFSTWTNEPEEWGEKWEGFGRRVASNFGKSVIKETTIYGLDEAFKIDSRFYRSEKRDFKSKVKNAVTSPFLARKPDGRKVFGFPRLAGTYASSIIAAETWYPGRYDYKDGLASGTISLGTTVLVNLVKEFIWKK